MTDIQMMTLSAALLVALSLLLLSNSRITDAKKTLRADIQTLRTEMQAKHGEARFHRFHLRHDPFEPRNEAEDSRTGA